MFVALAVGLSLAAQRVELAPARIRALEEAIEAERAHQGAVGLSVAVAAGGVLQWSAGFGSADLENGVPARAATVYRLGSISKPFTAVAAMQLYEQGKLDLDVPVQKYVPAFPEKQWPITPRQLLCHQTGIRHYKPGEIDSTRHYTDLTEPLKIFSADPLLFEPGTKLSYTTYGYNLLGSVVEAASGMKFMDYLKANIFQPAGLTAIRDDNSNTIVPNRTRFYRRSPKGEIENAGLADTSNKIPGGGLVSTAEDLVKFALALRRGALLQPKTVEMMFTPQKTRDGAETRYGLGWVTAPVGGPRSISHSGGQQGCRTLLTMFPDRDVVVAVMANSEHAKPTEFVLLIVKALAAQ